MPDCLKVRRRDAYSSDGKNRIDKGALPVILWTKIKGVVGARRGPVNILEKMSLLAGSEMMRLICLGDRWVFFFLPARFGTTRRNDL